MTEDRKGNGLILDDSIKENITLSKLEKVSSRLVMDERREKHEAEDFRRKLNIKTPDIGQRTGNLSGGNQQKVMLSKWIFAEPDILILDEPTRGIDVGAKYEIYGVINQLAEAGKAVIMISSELPELLGMCDRIYTMCEGEITAEFSKEEADQEKLMKYMTIRMKRGGGVCRHRCKRIKTALSPVTFSCFATCISRTSGNTAWSLRSCLLCCCFKY